MSAALHVSLKEFLARPDREDDQREELVEGELIVSPSAKVWHSAIVRRLRVQLAALESKDNGFVLVNDFACLLGNTSMPAPDLAAVSESRWNQAEDNEGWLAGSPELVIEVYSPSNRKLQRKTQLYLEDAAEQVWIVYCNTRTVTVLTHNGAREVGMEETIDLHRVKVSVPLIFVRS